MNLDKKNTKFSKPFYDKVLNQGALLKVLSGKHNYRVATAMVYERIGDSEKFIGGFPLIRGKYDIGEYLVLEYKGGKKYFMDHLGSEVYTPCEDKSLNKIVEVVKFSDDDFRIRTKLNDTFFKETKEPVMEEKPLLNDNGEQVYDENGEPIIIRTQAKDEKGNFKWQTFKREYTEPLGVSQSGRDAIRIHNNTKNGIKEFRAKNQGFWAKYANTILPIAGLAIIAMVFLFGMKFMTDSWKVGVESLTGEIKDANDNLQWWQQPDALDKISQAVVEKQDEKEAPPVK